MLDDVAREDISAKLRTWTFSLQRSDEFLENVSFTPDSKQIFLSLNTRCVMYNMATKKFVFSVNGRHGRFTLPGHIAVASGNRLTVVLPNGTHDVHRLNSYRDDNNIWSIRSGICFMFLAMFGRGLTVFRTSSDNSPVEDFRYYTINDNVVDACFSGRHANDNTEKLRFDIACLCKSYDKDYGHYYYIATRDFYPPKVEDRLRIDCKHATSIHCNIDNVLAITHDEGVLVMDTYLGTRATFNDCGQATCATIVSEYMYSGHSCGVIGVWHIYSGVLIMTLRVNAKKTRIRSITVDRDGRLMAATRHTVAMYTSPLAYVATVVEFSNLLRSGLFTTYACFSAFINQYRMMLRDGRFPVTDIRTGALVMRRARR